MENKQYGVKSTVKNYFIDLLFMAIQNKKLFIFDLDGTLVDTAPDFKNSINYMLNELNESEVSLEEIRNWVG